MNSIFKKNKTMILTLIVTGVTALVLLCWGVVILIEWSEYRDRTVEARDKVQKLVKSTPAPGKENEERIRKDIALYIEKNRGLVDNFKSPLRYAVDVFLKELPPPNAEELTEEEIETYKVVVEDSGEETDGEADVAENAENEGETEAKLPEIRKFTYEDFRTFFPARFEKFCSDNNIPEEDKLSLSVLERFSAYCTKLFPQGSWNRAVSIFARAARPLTHEVINEANQLPILLYAFGLPRRVDKNEVNLRAQVDAMIKQRILPGIKNMELGEHALEFVGGGTGAKDAKLAVKDYPMAFFHWDVFGDMTKRLDSAGVFRLDKVIFRSKKAEGGEGGASSGVSLAESFEEDGDYKIYHYTLVFVGSMESIRKAMTNFDTAWQGDEHGRGRRMYVVRGLALYAGDDGAGKIMDESSAVVAGENNTSDTGRTARRSGRQSRRIRSGGDTAGSFSASGAEPQFRALSESSREEARIRYYTVLMRLRQEEARERGEEPPVYGKKKSDDFAGESSFTDNRDEKTRAIDEFEESLPVNERFGYATILVGEHNRECVAYLDLDYVVLEQKQ